MAAEAGRCAEPYTVLEEVKPEEISMNQGSYPFHSNVDSFEKCIFRQASSILAVYSSCLFVVFHAE